MTKTKQPVAIQPGQPVIFDMDGVLVDTEPLNEQHMEAFLTSLGVKKPAFDPELKGFNSQTIWILLKQQYKLQQNIDELIAQARNHYLDFLKSLDQLPAVAGTRELVEYLDSLGCKLAIGSSASPRRIKFTLEKLGIARYFPVIISGDDIARSKPAPDVFLLAAKKLDADPADCIVIEDAYNGVTAAKAAGMTCIAYTGAEHNHDDLSAADLIIRDFAEFTDSLKKDLEQ
jgi:beta-phosphoglucomutase